MSIPPSFKAAGGKPPGLRVKDCFSQTSTEISERVKLLPVGKPGGGKSLCVSIGEERKKVSNKRQQPKAR